ncbi:MAG: branched-chain amino acid ABC transporter permease [Chloroflexi bacterium]|nr:branched-chain amino acid ABC transporter permease [Chloroflexota bacterium]
MELEVKREKLVLRAGTQKFEWHIEPRYWRMPAIWISLLFVLPIVIYFVNPSLLPTIIDANLLAAIAIPLGWMTIGTGRMNFGPQFYIAAGGYAAALCSIHLGWGPAPTLLVALLTGLFFGILMSPLSIIAGGLYYTLLTLLFPLVFLEVTFIYTDIFKGDVGLFGILPLISIGNFTLNQFLICMLALIIMLIYLLIVDKLLRSKFAPQMSAINDDEEVAEAMGVNVKKVKIISFTIPAVMMAVIGWFYAHYYGTFAGITYLPLAFMLKILMVSMIGGRVQIYGNVIGGYFIAGLELALIMVLGDYSSVVFPIILLVLLLTLPEGLFGLYRKRRYREYLPTLHVRR